MSSRLNPSLNDEVVNGIHEILADVGLEEKEEEISELEELSHVQKIFKQRGAGIASAATKISNLMNSDKPEIALRATEIALKANSVYSDAEKKRTVPQININILSGGQGGPTLVNLIMPNQS